MSLIRNNHKMTYVKGMSQDYVFLSSGMNEEPDYVEDYGDISNDGLVEIIAGLLYLMTNDSGEHYRVLSLIETRYLVKKMAKKLGVSLEEKPLSWEEAEAQEKIEHNKQHWNDFVETAAKTNQEIYSESKGMWDYWTNQENSLGSFMTREYKTFDKYLEERKKQRDAAKAFVDKHRNDWESINVPFRIFEAMEYKKDEA